MWRSLRAIGRIPPAEREAVRLRVVDELEYGEIARRLNCSVVAARRSGSSRAGQTHQAHGGHDMTPARRSVPIRTARKNSDVSPTNTPTPRCVSTTALAAKVPGVCRYVGCARLSLAARMAFALGFAVGFRGRRRRGLRGLHRRCGARTALFRLSDSGPLCGKHPCNHWKPVGRLRRRVAASDRRPAGGSTTGDLGR